MPFLFWRVYIPSSITWTYQGADENGLVVLVAFGKKRGQEVCTKIKPSDFDFFFSSLVEYRGPHIRARRNGYFL